MPAETSPATPRVAVALGRFQPPQRRHFELLTRLAASHALVLVLVTASRQARDPANPLTLDERMTLLSGVWPPSRVRFLPLADCCYDDSRWTAVVQAVVRGELAQAELANAAIDCVSLERGEASTMTQLFPDWRPLDPGSEVAPWQPDLLDAVLTATPEAGQMLLEHWTPPGVAHWLGAWRASPDGLELAAESAFVQQHRAAWAAAPFPPVLVTVDVLARYRDSVLLVRRGRRPGLGLLALPGGFLDPGETLAAAAWRELCEETGLSPALEPAFPLQARVFDHPLRSRRGRTITHLYTLDLSLLPAPPQVAGGDDAADAFWRPLSTLRPEAFFEDHYAILQVMLGLP